MDAAQRYECWCGTERTVPENPRTGPKSIRMGCAECETITTHKAVGRT